MLRLFFFHLLYFCLFALDKLPNGIHLLRLLFFLLFPYTFPQCLLWKNDVASLGFFTFFDRVQYIQIVLNSVLPLELKDEAILHLISLFFNYLPFNLKLGMRLLYLLANSLEALRRHHERLSGFVPLVRLLIYRKLIVDFVLLFFEIFLEMSVILSSQRYNYSCFSFFVVFFLIDTFVFLLFDPDDFKRSGVDVRYFFFLFGHEHNFRQIFNCVRNDLIDKLVVYP